MARYAKITNSSIKRISLERVEDSDILILESIKEPMVIDGRIVEGKDHYLKSQKTYHLTQPTPTQLERSKKMNERENKARSSGTSYYDSIQHPQ